LADVEFRSALSSQVITPIVRHVLVQEGQHRGTGFPEGAAARIEGDAAGFDNQEREWQDG
jgi:hypothetical protein